MKIKFLFLFFLAFLTGPKQLCASENSDDHVVFRSFDQEKIEAYKTDPDYYINATPPSAIAWQNFVSWLSQKLKIIFKDASENRISVIIKTVFKIILWGLGIFAVVMIFFSLFKQGIFNVIQKTDKKIDLHHQNLDDHILETNWHSLVKSEIEAERYNVALRLLFLQTIQLLNEKQFIRWERNKTNFDYLSELRKKDLDKPFAHLIQYYNFGWFGDFKIKETEFQEIHSEFKTFNTSLL